MPVFSMTLAETRRFNHAYALDTGLRPSYLERPDVFLRLMLAIWPLVPLPTRLRRSVKNGNANN
jgi:hypothetical protein